MSRTTRLSNRIPELDGLRAIAILLVIAFHYLEPIHRTARGWRLLALAPARMGWIGVDLFFVLSGFLIASILLANRDSSAFFSTFYLRRFCRILPLYVPLVVVLFALHQLRSAEPQPPLYAFLTFTHNFWIASERTFGNGLLAVTWSLAVEEQFYLLLPALVRFNRSRRFFVIVLACTALAPLLRLAFLAAGGADAFLPILVLLPTRLDPLMLGVAAAWLSSRGITIHRKVLWPAWILSGCWIAMAALHRRPPGPTLNLSMAALSNLVIATFCLATLLLALGGSFRFLRWRWLTYTGVISYGLYLFHTPVKAVLYRFAPGLGAGLPIGALILSFATAAASWELYEKRFVRFGHRFAYDREEPVPAAVPASMPEVG